MSWLSEIEKEVKEFRETTQDLDPEYLSIQGAVLASTVEETERMARVIRALVRFIKLNIDFDAPLRPVGLSNLPPDAKELIIKIEE